MTKFLILYRKKVVKSESYSLSRPPLVYAEFVSQSNRKKLVYSFFKEAYRPQILGIQSTKVTVVSSI